MRRIAAILALALPLAITSPIGAVAAPHSATAATPAVDPISVRLDDIVDRALAEQRLVGTVVIVIEDGKVRYRRAAGFADRETRSPMRTNSIFRLASVSKPYVSAAAMRLVEDGKLRLDDPVTRWIPDFRPKLADGRTPVITIRQLITHTSGLGYGTGDASEAPFRRLGISTGGDGRKVTLEENLRRLGQAPLLQAPGSKFTYSMSIDVLGRVIERVTGERLQTAVDRLVLTPLSLKDTGFHARAPGRLTVAYADGKPQPVRVEEGKTLPLYNFQVNLSPGRALDRNAYPSGGAGMVGSAEDFARFAEAIRTGGGPILKPATVADMLRDHVGPQALSQGPGWGFGYGWAVLVDPAAAKSPMSRGTVQWSGAYGHNWFIDPARKLVVVALTNTAFEGMNGRFTTELRDAVCTAPGVGSDRPTSRNR